MDKPDRRAKPYDCLQAIYGGVRHNYSKLLHQCAGTGSACEMLYYHAGKSNTPGSRYDKQCDLRSLPAGMNKFISKVRQPGMLLRRRSAGRARLYLFEAGLDANKGNGGQGEGGKGIGHQLEDELQGTKRR
ncbi:hypothetical protein KTQ42_22905 [Noviherbaspirillum sp. L7-7A]|uniref:hypothetical protein n=1 Tax=Noviherbaspirillum sp. L7-7A TaxID=2850560 RepID=UPI001C2B7F43|nr:hypothetical protein [Noviherbaspirillum sp. L7-7A]MBV0882130.1 hypothetical protein [Noviherbaspirillum sp. L7-7A]